MASDVKILKMITGEEVMARITNSGGLITLDHPMMLQAIPQQTTGQMGVALIPWLMSGKSTKLTISEDHVIALDDPQDQAEKNYLAQVTGLTL
jgi:hypothetical protein|tara:strand:- start:123 stop:401 length:279 start_codon:yes stop_codon:yes gene_type:complete